MLIANWLQKFGGRVSKQLSRLGTQITGDRHRRRAQAHYCRPACVVEGLECRSLLTPTVTISMSPSNLDEYDQTMMAQGTQYFTINLDEIAETDITVSYSFSGTATGGGTDYTDSFGGSVTIYANMMSAMVSVNAVADGVVEGDETIVMTIGSGTGYIGGATATMNLIDEPLPTVTINMASSGLYEYDTMMMAPGNQYFNLNLNRIFSTDLTVSYSMNGTATNTTDYSDWSSGTATIYANMMSAMIPVTAVRDGVVEGDETINMTIVPGTNYIDGATATMNLIDEPLPTVSISMSSGDALEWDPTMDAPLAAQVQFFVNPIPLMGLTVSYTVSGTATNGTDYAVPSGLSGTFMLMAGMPGMNLLDILPKIDAAEGNETVIITLTFPAGCGYQPGTATSVTFNIIDAPTPSVSLSFGADAYEYDALMGAPITGGFVLNRTGPYLSQELTVNLNLSGSATNGVDYNEPAPTLVTSVKFLANSSTVNFDVVPIEDLDYAEGTGGYELVNGSIAPSSDYTIVPGFAPMGVDVKIFDAAKPEVTITVYDEDAAEGFDDTDDAFDVARDDGSFHISRTGSTKFPLLIWYNLASGTATFSTDYTLTNHTIPADATSVFVIVKPLQDTNFLEGPETAVFRGVDFAGTPYTMTAQDTATITIQDVNRAPVVNDKQFYIPSNRTGLLGNVGASDRDTGQTLTLTMTPSSGVPFSIDSAGNITITGILDQSVYNLTVTATDNGFPPKSDSGLIQVNVYSFNAAPRTVNFTANHSLFLDPTVGASDTQYPAVEWVAPVVGAATAVAYTSGLGSGNKRLNVTAQFTVSDNWSFPNTQLRATTTDGYVLPATVGLHSSGGTGYDILTVSIAASADFDPGAKYLPDFKITWEINIGGAVWISVGDTTNPLYLTWKIPSGTLYRTVLHVGTVGASSGGSSESGVISGVWGQFSDNIVTRWDGGNALVYNHVPEPALDIPFIDDVTVPSNTKELLTYGHGQCDSWQDFLISVLKGQGVQSASGKKIVAKEGDGFYVNNMAWNTPNAADIRADGYNWRLGSTVFKGGSMAGQGLGTPDQIFNYHQVVVINGEVFDPSYGLRKANLSEWEDGAVAGVWDVLPLFGTTEYAKKRIAGDTLVEYE